MKRNRPPPLRIKRQERKTQIQRPAAMVAQTHALQCRQPLIIQTFSPEVIQANAHDFMQLVQKLTGQGSDGSPLAKRLCHLSHGRNSSEDLHLSPTLYNLGVSSFAIGKDQQITTAESGLDRSLFPLNSGLPTSLSPRNWMHGGISVLSPASFEFSPSMVLSPKTFLRDFPRLLSPQAAALLSPRLSKAGDASTSVEFAPSIPLSPKTFLRDFPRLLSPQAAASPRLAKAGDASASFEFSPSIPHSPKTFLRDFPSFLSPQAAALLSPRQSTKAGDAARCPVMMLPEALPSPGSLTSAFLADLPVLSPAAYKWIEKHPLSAEFMLSPLPRGRGLPPRSPSPTNMSDHCGI